MLALPFYLYYYRTTKYGEASGELVEKAELLAVSQEVFGQDNYGQLAIDIIDHLRHQAFISVTYLSDPWDGEAPLIVASGLTHNESPDSDIMYKHLFAGKAATRATIEDIRVALFDLLDGKPTYFDYVFSDNPGADFIHDRSRDQRAFMVPISLTKEALGRYMTSPRGQHWSEDNPGELVPHHLSDHQLHGAIGRAIDVLLQVSGVKESIDPDSTAVDGDFIDYDEFRNEYLKYFVTPSVRNNFRHNTTYGAMWQIIEGRPKLYPFEIVIEGDTRLFDRFAPAIDRISVDSLKAYGAQAQQKTIGPITANL